MESNEKLMDWSGRRFQNKVVDKVSITIAEEKVQLQEKVQVMIELIHKVQHLYIILLDVSTITNNVGTQINKIEAKMKRSNNIILESARSSTDY